MKAVHYCSSLKSSGTITNGPFTKDFLKDIHQDSCVLPKRWGDISMTKEELDRSLKKSMEDRSIHEITETRVVGRGEDQHVPVLP